ncbi:hypothetical protein B0H17DRAFT_1200903 [Mycena rosella]|uniref:Uncharacterized protein n=1 Tax=Mycena rosella TaxID=1033263 RepID=A0AAD7DHY5_MYCRO|nr:hypothetical protein B0H17DRAFT_1200903 [Mycena rosella]
MHLQGVDSPTFSPAPVDGSLTVPQLLEHHFARSPNHMAYIYGDPDGNIVSISFEHYLTTVHTCCHRVLRDITPSRGSDNAEGIVVGIFAVQGCLYSSPTQTEFEGAPLNKRVGDALVFNGVVLCSIYGAMEVGLVTRFFENYGRDWDYFIVREEFNIVRVPEADGSGLYTLTYLSTVARPTLYTNTELGGAPRCAVSDLLEHHPENPQLHRVYGRKDGILVLSIATKMNPARIDWLTLRRHVAN